MTKFCVVYGTWIRRLIFRISIWNWTPPSYIYLKYAFRATGLPNRSRRSRISLIKYNFILNWASSLGPSPSLLGGFTLKTHQLSSVHARYTGGIWKRNYHWSFWICVWGQCSQGNHVIIATSSFSKSSVLKMFSVHTKTKSRRFLIPSGLFNIVEKLRFRDGLVWMVSQTVEIKLSFQIYPAWCGRYLNVIPSNCFSTS